MCTKAMGLTPRCESLEVMNFFFIIILPGTFPFVSKLVSNRVQLDENPKRN